MRSLATSKGGLGRAVSALAIGIGALGLLAAASPSSLNEGMSTPGMTPVPIGEVAPAASRWSIAAATQLAGIAERAGSEGLDPHDYQPGALRRAIVAGEGASLDATADATALGLAHDYLMGRVGDRAAMGWLIERSPYEALSLPGKIQAAAQSGTLDQFYAGLLPGDRRYAALREALAAAPDAATRDRLRANMERARWLPREAPSDYLYVNVPSYQLAVMSGGEATSTYTVVVGAPDTPTPQMISPTSSLVVNPWWNVPQSIVKKSNIRPGRAGFQFASAGGGSWTVRQPPGPRNALGRIKFNLVNDQAIYLHDTPAKSAFGRPARALSHGCVRVKDINRLAGELMDQGGDATVLDTALAGSATATVRLPQTWPVYIVYFTADLSPSGSLVSYDDPYGYDQRIIAALDGPKFQMASR